MTENHTSWISKVGPWTALLCFVFVLLALVSVVQIYYVRVATNDLVNYDVEIPGMSFFVWLTISSIIIKMLGYLICAVVIATQFRRPSIFIVIGIIWFVFPILPVVTHFSQQSFTAIGEFMSPSLNHPFYLIFNIVVTTYLLFSRRVGANFNLTTRTQIPDTLARLFQSARGR